MLHIGHELVGPGTFSFRVCEERTKNVLMSMDGFCSGRRKNEAITLERKAEERERKEESK